MDTRTALNFLWQTFAILGMLKRKIFLLRITFFFLLHFMADTSVATAKRKSINEQKQVKRDGERHESTLGWRELQNLKRLKNLRHIFTLY